MLKIACSAALALRSRLGTSLVAEQNFSRTAEQGMQAARTVADTARRAKSMAANAWEGYPCEAQQTVCVLSWSSGFLTGPGAGVIGATRAVLGGTVYPGLWFLLAEESRAWAIKWQRIT